MKLTWRLLLKLISLNVSQLFDFSCSNFYLCSMTGFFHDLTFDEFVFLLGLFVQQILLLLCPLLDLDTIFR